MSKKSPEKTLQPDVATKKLSFEDTVTQLNQLVEKLESGDLSLEDSVSAFERGVVLSRHCESLLDKAESRLNILNPNA